MFAASSGLRVEAMTDMADRITMIESRFHNGQFYEPLIRGSKNWAKMGRTRGSFGSSVGCGTRISGIGPLSSYFNLPPTFCCVLARLSSSMTKDVPGFGVRRLFAYISRMAHQGLAGDLKPPRSLDPSLMASSIGDKRREAAAMQILAQYLELDLML